MRRGIAGQGSGQDIGDVAGGPAEKVRIITAALPPDRSHVKLTMQPGSGATGEILLTAHGLHILIQTLGKAHATMREGQPMPDFDLRGIPAVVNPRWHVSPGLMGEASAFAFHHPAYGPLCFLVPIEQIETMVEALSRQIQQSRAGKQTSRN